LVGDAPELNWISIITKLIPYDIYIKRLIWNGIMFVIVQNADSRNILNQKKYIRL
jgi:hypothetical protein